MLIKKKLASLLFVSFLFIGCGPGPVEYEETTDAFVGRLVQNGEPITFSGEAVLNLIHHGTSDRFGVPLKSDGSFVIGWMPTGKYSAELKMRRPSSESGSRTARDSYDVPGGLLIEKDKNEYEIELGEKWEP